MGERDRVESRRTLLVARELELEAHLIVHLHLHAAESLRELRPRFGTGLDGGGHAVVVRIVVDRSDDDVEVEELGNVLSDAFSHLVDFRLDVGHLVVQ